MNVGCDFVSRCLRIDVGSQHLYCPFKPEYVDVRRAPIAVAWPTPRKPIMCTRPVKADTFVA